MALLAFELPLLSTEAPSSSPATTTTATMGNVPPVVQSTLPITKSKSSSSVPAPITPMPASIAALLDPQQRLRTARELNRAILTSQNASSETKAVGLLRMLAWGEDLLKEKAIGFPACEWALLGCEEGMN